MSKRKFAIIDTETGAVIATSMDLDTALLLMRAFCEEYYEEPADLRLVEIKEVIVNENYSTRRSEPTEED